MGLVTRGCPLSQPGLLSLLDTCTTRLIQQGGCSALSVMLGHFGVTPEHVSQGKPHARAETSFATRPGFAQAGAKAPHAHPSTIASTAPLPQHPKGTPGPCQPPQSHLSTLPTAGCAHWGPCPPPAARQAGGVLALWEAASYLAAVITAAVNTFPQLAKVQRWRQPHGCDTACVPGPPC